MGTTIKCALAEDGKIKKYFGEAEIFARTGKFATPAYSLPKIKKMADAGMVPHKYLMPSDYIIRTEKFWKESER